MCEYCNYYDLETGMKEANTPLLKHDSEFFGANIGVLVAIEKRHLILLGEASDALEKIPIKYCPVCGRFLD